MITHFDDSKNNWDLDYENYLSQHDVVFRTPVYDPLAGIPIGDGDTGTLLCFEKDRLILHVNKTDLFDESSKETGVYTSDEEENFTSLRHGAEISIEFGAPIFDLFYLNDFCARLELFRASAHIDARTPFGEVRARGFASHAKKVTVIECEYATAEAMPLSVKLRRWGSRTFAHLWEIARDANIGLGGTRVSANERELCVVQSLRGTEFCVLVRIVSDAPHTLEKAHAREAEARFESGTDKKFRLFITVETAKTGKEAEALARQNLDAAARETAEALYAEHCLAWKEFWEKSYVRIPDRYLENLWYLNFYYANCECKGVYPPHFCNGIWTFRNDHIPWNFYFHYNLQLHTFPLNAANHPELLQTYLNFKHKQLDKAKAFCREQFGCDGAFYADVYDKDGKQNVHTKHNYSCGGLVAIGMYRHYLYTRDEAFLSSHVLPVINAVAAFYLHVLSCDPQGIYHIESAQAYEGSPFMDDPVTDLAIVKALFGILSNLYPEHPIYREVHANLAPFCIAELDPDEYDAAGNFRYGIGAGKRPLGARVVAAGRESRSGEILRKTHGNPKRERYYGFPCVELAPLYPSGAVGLADRDSEIFRALYNTMMLHPQTLPDPVRQVDHTELCMGWCLHPVFLARLGMAKELKVALTQTVSTWIVYPQGFGLYGPLHSFAQEHADRFKTGAADAVSPMEEGRQDAKRERIELPNWEYRHFDYETLPILATAVNEMLLQSYDGVLRVFPAVEQSDEICFTLAAEGGATVRGELCSGEYRVVIERGLDRDCRVVLPSNFAAPVCYGRRSGVWQRIFLQTEMHKNEVAFRIDFADCASVSLSSTALNDMTMQPIPTESRNESGKRCGQSKLGEVKMY